MEVPEKSMEVCIHFLFVILHLKFNSGLCGRLPLTVSAGRVVVIAYLFIPVCFFLLCLPPVSLVTSPLTYRFKFIPLQLRPLCSGSVRKRRCSVILSLHFGATPCPLILPLKLWSVCYVPLPPCSPLVVPVMSCVRTAHQEPRQGRICVTSPSLPPSQPSGVVLPRKRIPANN